MLNRPIRAVRGESSERCTVGTCVNCGKVNTWLLPLKRICLACDLATPPEFCRRHEVLGGRKEPHA